VSPNTATDLTTSEQVTVKVKNFGQQPVSNVLVSLTLDGVTVAQETVTGTIISYQEVDFTFHQTLDLSVAKTYTLEVATGLTGDSNAGNDAATKQVRNYGHFEIAEFPYYEGFEYDTTLVFWKQQIEEYDSLPVSWIYAAGSSEWSTANISGAHSGERNAQFTTFISVPISLSLSRYRTKLVTPRIHLANLNVPQLSFWHAQPSDLGDFFHLDTLKVYYKTSENDEWQLLYTEDRTLNDWTETTLALPDKTNDYYIAFEGVLDGGWDVVLDDVTLQESPLYDAKMLEIISPQSGFDMTTETVKVKLQNFGGQPLTNIPVKFTVNGELVGNEVVNGTFASSAETVYVFNTLADLSEEREYEIKAFVDVSSDINHANDTVTIIVNNYNGKAVMGMKESVTTCNTEFYDNGVGGDYTAGSLVNGYTETMTFYPATAGSRIKAEFESYEFVPLIEWQGMLFPGDTLFVYDGASATQEGFLGYLIDSSSAETTLPVFESTTPEGALTFVFHKVSVGIDVAAGWKANISCHEPKVNDVGIKAIVMPVAAGDENAQVKVKIQNYGSAPQSNFPVTVNVTIDGASWGNIISETFTGTLNSGEITEFTFNETVNLSVISDNIEVTACAALEGDMNIANDCQTKNYILRTNVELAGFRLFDRQNQAIWGGSNPIEYGNQTYRFVKFNSNETENLNVQGVFNFNTNGFIVSGAYAHDTIFAFTANQGVDNNISTPDKYLTLDTNYNILSSTPFAGSTLQYLDIKEWSPEDVTYDYSTNSLLGVVNERVPSRMEITPYLLRFDVNSGTLAAYIRLTLSLNCIAADNNGNLYGIGSNEQGAYFASVNKQTGAVNIISQIGVLLEGNQSMTFDHNTNRLFWAVSARMFENLYEISPATGAIYDFGRIGSGAEIVALYTPYDVVSSAIDNNLANDLSITVFPNPSDGKQINISNVPQNAQISILDLSGRTLQTVKNQSGNVNIKTNLRQGIYLIKVNRTTRKLVVK
jgi:hypothetical protein